MIEAVKAGKKILMEQQESMSEEDRKHISKRKKRGEKEREKEKGEKANSKGKGNNEKEKEIAKIYPSLKDLTISSASSDSSDSELDKDEEADLEEEAARYERERYDPDWSYRTKPMKRGASANKRTKPKVPTVPPYNPDYTGEKESTRAVRPRSLLLPRGVERNRINLSGFC